jgi:hypothetical protein|tara:strand:+ start:241 stop:372 length:132 start_codon:yes stop_codon:yes gene_type:complete
MPNVTSDTIDDINQQVLEAKLGTTINPKDVIKGNAMIAKAIML